MLESIGKKFIHSFVIASIIFGCSVQAATPSFQEDLDDFEEIQHVADGNSITPIFEPPLILWQNENLAQTVTSSHGVTDDFEKHVVQANAATCIDFLKYALHTVQAAFFEQHLLGFHQARAP
ncbi:MAG: hypothetical protein EB073_05720, partial [Burkholderiaceae bacterium]|nr:hypothetical protein [Burkholderiaceae bacterium]